MTDEELGRVWAKSHRKFPHLDFAGVVWALDENNPFAVEYPNCLLPRDLSQFLKDPGETNGFQRWYNSLGDAYVALGVALKAKTDWLTLQQRQIPHHAQ